MNKDLTTSVIDRQNVLNNPYALAEIEKAAGLNGIVFEGRAIEKSFHGSLAGANAQQFSEFSKPSPN